MRRPVVIAGGGTGGHVFPGLALAEELRRRDAATPLAWIGAEGGLEARLVPQAGLPITLLPLAGIARMGAAHGVRALLLAARATLRLALRFAGGRPALVVGVGGFASGPAVLAAALTGTPTLLLEQNAIPGATNRWASRFAKAAAVSFAESARGLRCRVVVTGNPVRAEIAALPPRPERAVRTLLAFGGSRGARALNDAWCGTFPLLVGSDLALTVQTGPDDQPRVAEAAATALAGAGRGEAASAPEGRALRIDVRAFLDDMPARLSAADLVVARSGATTVAELAAAGRAAILVPFPGAANDHQAANARALEAQGAALVIDQRELTPARLADVVLTLAAAPERVAAMSAAARALARPEAARHVADLALELAGEAA